MTIYSAETLDLSRLQALQLVDANFERLFAAHKAGFVARWEAERLRDPTLPAYDVQVLETDPIVMAARENSYRRLLDLQALNDAARRLTLAHADGEALAHLAATYHRTQRAIIQPATTDTAAVYESDDELRARAQLAPEALADLGLTAGGYIYFVRTAFAASIKDARPIRRGGGGVELRLLGRGGNGAVASDILAEVIRAFQPEGMTQSTDILSVFSAEIETLSASLTLLIPRGPDPSSVTAAAQESVNAYRAGVHRIGATVYAEAIANAAHVGSVIAVRVNSPAIDDQGRLFAGRPEAAPYFDEVAIDTEVV